MKILIDRNIEIRAMTHVTEMAPKVTKWGPHYVTVDVAQRVHLAPKEKDTFGREQLPYLATLCNSANQGKLEFFTSFELRMEGVRQKGRSEGCMGIDMLRDVPLKNVPSPLQRSILIGATGTTSIGVTEEEQMTFFQSIQHPRFLQLRKAIGDAHIDDIFHLWTAEVASLDVFLTMDRRFWNVVNKEKRRIQAAVLVTTPQTTMRTSGFSANRNNKDGERN